MPKKQPQLAKLTRPRLHKAVARERLFSLLDEASEHKPAICVIGPPGAGKTTLVASWLDAHGIKGIWYQVDAGDADLATFFYYLGEAAKPFTRKGQRPLPLLTPEYLQDIEGFARRFFRELFARLPEEATLVLDNYQEVAPAHVFHPLIAQAVDEVPAGATLIAVSRRDPPDAYARLIANDNVRLVDWDDLKLTMDETQSIARSKANVEVGEIGRLHELCGCWAAGLTLLLEHERKGVAGLDSHHAEGVDAIFEYFATQIFDRVPRETQHFLVSTAFLPRVTVPVAKRLTGNAGAGAILEDLYRRHLFTHRRAGELQSYQYHALFQTFLKGRARQLLSAKEERALVQHAASLLEKYGLTDDAVLLYADADEWNSMARLIRESAPSLLAQGRGQTLREWIGMLPMERAEADPWLTYWLGASLIPVDQENARQRLEQAFARFQNETDLRGQALAACGVIDSYYYEWSDFRQMPRWITSLERVLEQGLAFDAPETELHVYSSLLIAMLYGQPGHPMLTACADRVMEMIGQDIDVNHRVMGGTFLLSYSALTCDLGRGKRVVETVQPLLSDPRVTPLNQLWWRTRLGHLLWNMTEYEAAETALRESEEIEQSHGLSGLRSITVLTLNYRLLVALGVADFRSARMHMQRTEAKADSRRPMSVWHRSWGKIQCELGAGNARPAFESSREAVTAAFDSGMTYIQVACLIASARGYADFGSHDEVMSDLNRARNLATETCFAYLESEILLTEAYSLLRHGHREKGLSCLASAMEHARTTRYAYHMRWCSTMPHLCAEALAAGIEVDYVREVIRKYRLRPPSREIAEWPWPVRVRTLGCFEIWLDGERLMFPGKAPRKPLALLKAIIALGGENVPEQKLSDAIWPGEEADTALKALDVNCVRLRKLLGRQDAIRVGDESVSLNPDRCWVDAWAFDQICDRAEGNGGAGKPSGSLLGQALSLYQGEFLPTEPDAPWAIKQRERLRGKFTRLVETVGARLEAAGDWEQAIDCYRRGLAADELGESFYQGLMRCYRALGRSAEAMSEYRRMRHLLSVVLGIAPSNVSQSLARTLQRDMPAQHDTP
ncbi:MAG: BTAD domain-containing putative transcriptional regulator [Burkholderiales bacterium]